MAGKSYSDRRNHCRQRRAGDLLSTRDQGPSVSTEIAHIPVGGATVLVFWPGDRSPATARAQIPPHRCSGAAFRVANSRLFFVLRGHSGFAVGSGSLMGI